MSPQVTSPQKVIGGSWDGAELLSVEWRGTLTAPTTNAEGHANYAFDCAVANGAAILWLDDHLLCGTPELFRDQEELSRSGQAPSASVTEAPLPPFMRLAAGEPHFLRVQFFHNETTVENASLAVRWAAGGAELAPIPAAALSPTIPPPQATRHWMQRNLATGWGTW